MAGSKIFLVSQGTALCKRLKNMLNKNSYNVVGEAGDAISALRLIRAMSPDLVIVDFELQGMPAINLIKIIEEDRIANPGYLLFSSVLLTSGTLWQPLIPH